MLWSLAAVAAVVPSPVLLVTVPVVVVLAVIGLMLLVRTLVVGSRQRTPFLFLQVFTRLSLVLVVRAGPWMALTVGRVRTQSSRLL
jgi:hypothetical protein